MTREVSISIGNLVRITNSRVAVEQIGIVTRVTIGRVLF